MEPTDVTLEILRGIRDETRKTNERVDVLSTEVRGLATETKDGFAVVTDRIERVERRRTETEVRIATEIVGVAGAVREVRDLLREDRALRDRVDDHERRIVAIEKHGG
jgi:hypothetical protein